MKSRSLLAGLVLALAASASAQNDGIPDFGEGNAVSLSQEYLMGRAWLMQFRRQAPILSDPQLQDYTERLIYSLVETSQLKERRLEIVLVNNKTINAFAVPGGVVGVHNGLILAAQSEAQLASVLGHELAHLSQRHFSRSQENAQKSQKTAMLGLLGGLVAAAAGSGDAAMAAMMGSQAAAQDAALRYSRQHEQEADRDARERAGEARRDAQALIRRLGVAGLSVATGYDSRWRKVGRTRSNIASRTKGIKRITAAARIPSFSNIPGT